MLDHLKIFNTFCIYKKKLILPKIMHLCVGLFKRKYTNNIYIVYNYEHMDIWHIIITIFVITWSQGILYKRLI